MSDVKNSIRILSASLGAVSVSQEGSTFVGMPFYNAIAKAFQIAYECIPNCPPWTHVMHIAVFNTKTGYLLYHSANDEGQYNISTDDPLDVSIYCSSMVHQQSKYLLWWDIINNMLPVSCRTLCPFSEIVSL